MRSLAILSLFLSIVFTPAAFALQCGGKMVAEGDLKFEVTQKCGEPQMQEIIGYRLNARGDREMVVEQLIYGPWRGLYYVLEFEGGRLKNIETRIKR